MISSTPTEDEIRSWVFKYDVDVRKFFNVNGRVFKENNLRDKIDTMSVEECCRILSQDWMLIKRPIYMDETNILFGFKQKEWEENILKKQSYCK